MTSVSTDVAALGTALVLATLGGLWKAASLRGDMFDRWNRKITLAEAGLNAKASELLVILHQDISDLLFPPPGVAFDPTRWVEDPGEMRARVNAFLHLLDTRDRLRRRFQLLLTIGPILVVSLTGVALGLVGLFASLSGLVSNVLLSRIGAGITAGFGCTVAGMFGTYVYLQQRLSTAEILSTEQPTDD